MVGTTELLLYQSRMLSPGPLSGKSTPLLWAPSPRLCAVLVPRARLVPPTANAASLQTTGETQKRRPLPLLVGLRVDDLVWAQPSSTSGLGWVLSQAWGALAVTGALGRPGSARQVSGLSACQLGLLSGDSRAPRWKQKRESAVFTPQHGILSINIPLAKQSHVARLRIQAWRQTGIYHRCR